MSACNIVILLLGISILNVILPPVLCESLTSKQNAYEEILAEPVGVLVFVDKVPASGAVSIVGQSPGYSLTDGFQQWMQPYTPYAFVPPAYGPIPVPYAELMYPYMNWYPAYYPVPIEYTVPTYTNVYSEDIVDYCDCSVPVSGRVKIAANFGNYGFYPYPYEGSYGNNYITSPVINTESDYYNNFYPEYEVPPSLLLSARGGVTIAANF